MAERQYNYELCEERHGNITEAFQRQGERIGKVENRFLAIMTILVVNLLGIVGTLAVLLLRLNVQGG